MPIYLYQCPHCAARRDIVKPIAQLDRMESCEACETPMERRLAAPRVIGDYAGYRCPITDNWIEGRRAHQENLKRHGCRVLEGGETAALRKSRAQEEAALDRSVDATVEQFYETLPTEKREALAVAVQSGLDISLERK